MFGEWRIVVISVNCPGCDSKFEFGDYLGGLTTYCKNCRHPIPVPSSRLKTPAVEGTAQTVTGVTNELSTPVAPTKPVEDPPPVLNQSFDLAMSPEWAFEQARTLLRSGVDALETKQRLVARGLPLQIATMVLEKALEDRVGQQFKRLARDERQEFIHRALSALVGGAGILVAFWFFEPWSVLRTIISLLLSVVCIWFPDAMGAQVSKFSFNRTSPGVFIRWGSWFVLVLLTIRLCWIGIAYGS